MDVNNDESAINQYRRDAAQGQQPDDATLPKNTVPAPIIAEEVGEPMGWGRSLLTAVLVAASFAVTAWLVAVVCNAWWPVDSRPLPYQRDEALPPGDAQTERQTPWHLLPAPHELPPPRLPH